MGPCGCRAGSSEPFRGVTCAAALLVGGSLALNADIGGDADLQLQLGSLLYDETRYQEALVAFTEAAKSDDARVAVAGRKGTVRTALKVAEFLRARQEAEELVKVAGEDPEASHFIADALWSAGLFDEAEREYRAGCRPNPGFGARAFRSCAIAGRDQQTRRSARRSTDRCRGRSARRRDSRARR